MPLQVRLHAWESVKQKITFELSRVDPCGFGIVVPVPVFVFFLPFLSFSLPSTVASRVSFELDRASKLALCTRSHKRHRDMDRSTGRGLAETRDTMRRESNDRGIDELRQWRKSKMKGFMSRQTRAEDGQDRASDGVQPTKGVL